MSSQALYFTKNYLYVALALLICSHIACAANKRPFYIIAHMVNSIRQVKHYLDRGANSLETDIQFFSNGSVDRAFHGFPCDCFRTCHRTAEVPVLLKHIRHITDKSARKDDLDNNYSEKMTLLMLDLKVSYVGNKLEAGRDVARHVLEHLWSEDEQKPRVRVLVYVEATANKDVILGFLNEFQSRGKQSLLKDVGFDGGTGNIREIAEMFRKLGTEVQVWQGDGKSNCLLFYPDGRLRRAVYMRDSRESFIHKVYHWTIDLQMRMRLSLNVGVDAMLTNDPEDLVEVLQESYYKDEFRIATPDDDPFALFEGN